MTELNYELYPTIETGYDNPVRCPKCSCVEYERIGVGFYCMGTWFYHKCKNCKTLYYIFT